MPENHLVTIAVGIVAARDGLAMACSDVVVHTPEDVNGFQDGQLFLDKAGKRGPQENILTPGTYSINPHMFAVSRRQQALVRQGEVAVLISNIGKDPAEFEPEADATKTKQVGDAEASVVRSKGEAQAKAYRDQVDALTAQGVTTVEIMKAISTAGLRITPDILVGGAGVGGESGGLVHVLLAQLVRQQQAAATAVPAAAPPAGDT